MTNKKSVVIGFSGGLDTSYCVKYLTDELGYDVHSVTVNTGGFDSKELENIKKHAEYLGVKSHMNIDATKSYYDNIIKYLIYGNVLKNNTYPLSVSAERLSQAIHLGQYALNLGINTIVHGSTGAGNDQVRFALVLQMIVPNVEIITPIRDLKLSRVEEIHYLKSKGIKINFEKSAYSINKGLWGTSIGGRETLKSHGVFPEDVWPSQMIATENCEVQIVFNKGDIISVNHIKFDHPVEAINYLQKISSTYAIGRDVHVGDTIIGIKGRVAFEAAAPTIIIKAHHALEKHVLTKWQLAIKDNLSQFYGNWLHEGQVLDPVMRDIETFFTNSQKYVSGTVFVRLMPYRFVIEGIDSPHDLMSSAFGAYGEMNNGWSGEDVRGFTKIFGNQTSIFHQVNNIKYT